jgi:polysaccharide export outer membrane protein
MSSANLHKNKVWQDAIRKVDAIVSFGRQDVVFKSLFMLLVFGALLSGCSTTHPIGLASDVELTQLNELPVNSEPVAYKIRPFEPLEIQVFDSESLSGTYLPDENGRINFPLIGAVEAAGLTPATAAQAIESRLRGKYILEPQVFINPKEMQQPTISVGGEVKKPGTYRSVDSRSLLRAVYNAGGLSEYAKSDDVVIQRTVDGQKYIGVYNLTAIERGNYRDPVLFPDDIISVGDSPSRRLLQSVLTFIPLLTTTAILIDRVGN